MAAMNRADDSADMSIDGWL
jgi:nitrite reductase (NO-forming)